MTGDGWYTETSAELISTNGSSICELPSMSQSKRSHTQSGLTACGGSGWGVSVDCIIFEAGNWTQLTYYQVKGRDELLSWVNPDGEILLIGGSGQSWSTEIVYQNGTTIRSFDLKYSTWLVFIQHIF